MSQIRSKDTKPEIIVRRFLHKNGFRYRLHSSHLPGKPDIVLPKWKTIIFVHGCFWHGHADCKYFTLPATRSEWWFEKIGKNQLKDRENEKALKKEGWKIIVVWECDLKGDKQTKTLEKLTTRIIRK